MVSFDVISLFPSITVDYAIRVIDDKWDELEKHTTIPRNLYMRILKFCIKENRYFKYKDKIYTQCKGLPMGSPASPVVADIVMEELLNTCIGQLNEKPRFLTKYEDDLFEIIKNSAIDDTLKVFNNFHRQIQFTIEEEDNCRLPYLDTVIMRDGEDIRMDWYQKPTASGRNINFYSCQPKHVIMNMIGTFIKRVLTISDEKFHKNNKDRIIKILRMNAFPMDIIKNLLRDNKRKCRKDEAEPVIYKSMTYVPGISERLENSGIYNRERYRIASTTNNTLRQLFSSTKSEIDKMDNIK
ncbi:uncharacterized protein LOC119604103 [Lucilia sericata]|uniref:uncharacterized protein LOC119604103 n=1 Tax=Lucilia sericata TaxID=13632 RepID=UPI0018A85013|nr:uncharacterized protein LOC119604103 [Lucilia sericata]